MKDDFWKSMGVWDENFDGKVDVEDAILIDDAENLNNEFGEDFNEDTDDDEVGYDEGSDVEDCGENSDEDELINDFERNNENTEINNYVTQKTADNYGKVDYASQRYYNTIPATFIKRNLELEKELGIQDIHFYCYWLPDCKDVLIIVGEVIAQKINAEFSIRANVFDEEGDLIDTQENYDYTGRSGFSVRAIMPLLFFNRYPFGIELQISKEKLSKSAVVITPEKEENEDKEEGKIQDFHKMQSVSNLDITKELAKKITTSPIYAARMKKSEKLPKDMIVYFVEDYSGLVDYKCVFLKKDDSSSEYWANQITYTVMYSGKPKKELLVYYLFYNGKNELISWTVSSIWESKYINKCEKSFKNLPASENLGRIIIYVGLHPSGYSV